MCWFGFAGWLITWVFIPDTTGLDLREQDRYWSYVRAGRAGDYHGIAVHPRHLSVWERLVLGRHKKYDPEADRLQRVAEMRAAYEEFEQKRQQGQAEEKVQTEEDRQADEEDQEEAGLHGSASQFFASEYHDFFSPLRPVKRAGEKGSRGGPSADDIDERAEKSRTQF